RPGPRGCQVQHLRQHDCAQRRHGHDEDNHARGDGAGFQARLHCARRARALQRQGAQEPYRRPVRGRQRLGRSDEVAAIRRPRIPRRRAPDARGCPAEVGRHQEL
ncbi:hypothetical protein BN1708_009384, partial [Verticillium longisporum]